MNYQEIHDRIIFRAKTENRKKFNRNCPDYTYYEAHHILPRCLYPEYSNFKEYPWNKVLLTAREHYVIHQLLAKIHPENLSLISAAKNMTLNPYGNRSKNKLYEWVRLQFNNKIAGKTYEEVYGEEKAKLMKESRSNSHKGKRQYHQIGKTYIEIYGEERAKKIKESMVKDRRGKTHEEIYGVEQSKILKENLRKTRQGKTLEELVGFEKAKAWRKKNSEQASARLRGVSYLERYGSDEKVEEIRKKRSKSIKAALAKKRLDKRQSFQ